ncbi:hypothetical protein PR048_003205 [Dryococelus australis]|uniref:Uncharacterized protein n=1 Tax=Dryococelus australis TaxID=614101 RepID=A0ABQ9IMF2_9NEOP|nr:hypothetical protein PR048_003205 [Dryococelus australis]
MWSHDMKAQKKGSDKSDTDTGTQCLITPKQRPYRFRLRSEVVIRAILTRVPNALSLLSSDHAARRKHCTPVQRLARKGDGGTRRTCQCRPYPPPPRSPLPQMRSRSATWRDSPGSLTLSALLRPPSSSLLLSSSSTLLRGSHVILFSFLRRRRAFANHVDTCVSVILVMMASMIFSPLVGYGFFLCSLSHALSVLVVSLVAFFRRAPFRSMPYLQHRNTLNLSITHADKQLFSVESSKVIGFSRHKQIRWSTLLLCNAARIHSRLLLRHDCCLPAIRCFAERDDGV